MMELKMAADAVTQLVIQAGALGLLTILVVFIGPKMLKRVLDQHTKDNRDMVRELKRLRNAVHRNNNVTQAVVLYLAQQTGDVKLRKIAEKAMDEIDENADGDEIDDEGRIIERRAR